MLLKKKSKSQSYYAKMLKFVLISIYLLFPFPHCLLYPTLATSHISQKIIVNNKIFDQKLKITLKEWWRSFFIFLFIFIIFTESSGEFEKKKKGRQKQIVKITKQLRQYNAQNKKLRKWNEIFNSRWKSRVCTIIFHLNLFSLFSYLHNLFHFIFIFVQ